MKAWIGKARGSLKNPNLNKVWNQKNIPYLIMLKLYKACVRSVLLYRCESWPVKVCDLNSLQSIQLRCVGRILHKGHDNPKELIASPAKCDPIVSAIKTRHLLRTDQKFFVYGEEIVGVDEFTYLGSKIQLNRI